MDERNTGDPHFVLGDDQRKKLLGWELKQEREINTEVLPRKVGDFCIVANVHNRKGKVFERDWQLNGYLGDQVHLAKGEEEENKFVDKEKFWAMNFVNAEFVLEKIQEEQKKTGNNEGFFLEAFYKGEVDKILKFVIKKVDEYQTKFDKYKEYKLSEKAIEGLSITKNKHLSKVLLEKQQKIDTLKLELGDVDYFDLEEDLEKFITAMHSLVFIEEQIKRWRGNKVKR